MLFDSSRSLLLFLNQHKETQPALSALYESPPPSPPSLLLPPNLISSFVPEASRECEKGTGGLGRRSRGYTYDGASGFLNRILPSTPTALPPSFPTAFLALYLLPLCDHFRTSTAGSSQRDESERACLYPDEAPSFPLLVFGDLHEGRRFSQVD